MSLKMRFNRAEIYSFLSEHFFWIVIIAYIVSVFNMDVPIVIILSLLIISCYFTGNTFKKIKIDPIGIYFVFIILTGLTYSINGLPKSLMYTGIAYFAIPILMYFIPKYDIEKFYEKSFNAIFFSIVLAVILYLLQPEQYAQYLYDRRFTGGPLVAWVRPSLIQGLYGITTVASFCACGFIYYWWQLSYRKKHSGWKCLICLAVLLYCRRRAAVISAFLVFVFENLLLYKRGKNSGKRTAILILCACVFIGLLFAFRNQVMTLLERFTNISAGMNDRSSNWTNVVANLGSYSLFGKGIGSSNHAAVAAGYEGAVDGQYAMIICETGYFGLVLFVICQCFGMFSFLNNRREEYTCIALMMVLLFLLQSIGSNILEFPLLGAMFWYSLSALRGNKKVANKSIECAEKLLNET